MLRTIAGGVAVGVDISPWFLIVAGAGSLFMVTGKRHAEMLELGDDAGNHRPALELYSHAFLNYVRAVASSVAILAYCLWAFEESEAVGDQTWFELSIIPFVLGILRYALLLEQGRGGAPEDLVLSDRRLLAIGLVWALLFAVPCTMRSGDDLIDERIEVLSGWGRTAPTAARVSAPRDADEVVARLASAGPRGALRAWARAQLRRRGAERRRRSVLDLTDMDRVLEVDLEKGTCTVEAGVSLDTLMRSLIPLGWFPMVVPGTRYVTVGGAIASDIHGKFRHGSFCDYVERFQLVTPAHGVDRGRPRDATPTCSGRPRAAWD